MSLRLVRSPPAPKITTVHGPTGRPLAIGSTARAAVRSPFDPEARVGSFTAPSPLSSRSTQSLAHRVAELHEPGRDVAPEVEPQRPPSARREHLEVAARLR